MLILRFYMVVFIMNKLIEWNCNLIMNKNKFFFPKKEILKSFKNN